MQLLRFDSAAAQAMAGRWAVSVDRLHESLAPAAVGLSCQASTVAVNAAHSDVAAFTGALAARIGGHVAPVGEADAGYLTNEEEAANAMASVLPRMSGA